VEKLTLDGRRCRLYDGGDGPVFVMGTFGGENSDDIPHECAALTDRPFRLFLVETDDWDGDFSPWLSHGLDENEIFAGNGHTTLAWIRECAVPYLTERFGAVPFVTAGYSLAGLFALWALYESECFSGAVCCSGSLWYGGFEAYAREKGLRTGQSVYLSLGGKEERTSHPVACTIGDRTRSFDQLLSLDPVQPKHTLEWNSGGHFANSAKRLAKGIRWMLERGLT